MLKIDFFLAAAKAEEYRRLAWVITAFSLIKEGPDDWKKEPYAYRIVQTPTGHMFVDPANDLRLSPIEDAEANVPLFTAKETVKVKAGALANLSENIETTYGRLLVNFVGLVYPFGSKIPYINTNITAGNIEEVIKKRLKDTPANAAERNDKDIYVDEYLKFADAMFYLASFTQLCVPAATRKTMTQAPGIVELRTKLLEENKDRLHDPAVIAKIDAELVNYDKNWMKGDIGEGFLISKKSYNIVRKKLFGMHGAEQGLTESVDVDLIQNSLSEGWDISKFPIMNNSLRIGAFSRGSNTMLGGESVKWLYRASSNMTVSTEVKDCGSKFGNEFQANGENYTWLTGFNVITANGLIHVPDDEAAKAFVGKNVLVRSPMYCQLGKTDYCSCCVGDRLSLNPKALSSAVAEYGSVFLGIYMSGAHAKQLALAKMDYKTAIF